MDLPRLTLLKQLELRFSQEGKNGLFLARDRSNGKIYVVSRVLTQQLRETRAALFGTAAQTQDEKAKEEKAKNVFQFLHLVENIRAKELWEKTPINPVFMVLPLFDMGRYQRRLEPLANALVTPLFLIFMALLALTCMLLGIRNDWSVLSTFSTVFSLEAILTFGLIAPFLKIIHEAGHVLTATRYNVAVRKAGVFLISFYPLPYVDCTDADFSARRRHRVLISLAGIVVDVTIGMIAFILWHIASGSYLQVILGNIFVFSTLNSVLFNANPLAKLDGYFAISDAFGQRNLYTLASSRFSSFMSYLISFGEKGTYPKTGKAFLVIVYAIATIWYRIFILLQIALVLAPKYLGLGAFAVFWGMTVLFYKPMKNFVQSFAQEANKNAGPLPKQPRHKIWLYRAAILTGLIGIVGFIPFPYTTMISAILDSGQSYSVTSLQKGFVQSVLPAGSVTSGTVLATLKNSNVSEELMLIEQQIVEAQLALETARGLGAAKIRATQEQLSSLVERGQLLQTALEEQIVHANVSGYFVPTATRFTQHFIPAGQVLGVLFPSRGPAQFSGQFPERYVSKFQQDLVSAELRLNQTYFALPPEAFRLQAIMSYERSSGTRSYRVLFSHKEPAAQIIGQPAIVRFTFKSRPLWDHAAFYYQNLLANYRQSQLTDREDHFAATPSQ